MTMRTNEEMADEALALLEILKLGDRDIKDGKVTPLAEVVERLRSRGSEVG